MFRAHSLFAPDPSELKVWDNQPGGTIVDRYTEDGVRYVVVEFENSPGERYVYLAP